MGAAQASNVKYTVDQNEKAQPARVKFLKSVPTIGYAAIPLGLVSIVVGIVVLVYVNRYKFPFGTGLQIWSGLIIIAYGGVALLVGRSSDDMKQDISEGMTKKLRVFNGIGIGIFSSCGMACAWAIAGTIMCAIDQCSDPNSVVIALEAVSIVMTLAMIALAVYGHVLFCRSRKAFQIISCRERDDLEPRVIQTPGQEKTPLAGYEP